MAERELSGRVAVVTGASRGIGRAVAVRLAALGARVYAGYVRGAEEAAQTAELAAQQGGDVVPLRFDVASAEETSDAIRHVVGEAGKIDILVNNAGMTVDALAVRLPVEEWDRVMAVNLRGTFNCTKAVLRPMIRARYGRIVNISSVIGQMGNAGQAAYSAAKAGVIGFTRAMARELGSRNITVNAVAPGFVETEMTAGLPEERRREYLSLIPLGRLGSPDDVAAVVAFLAGPGAGYLTGQVIGVNGGLYM